MTELILLREMEKGYQHQKLSRRTRKMENFHNIKETSTEHWPPLDRSPESENVSSNLQPFCESLTSSSPPSELLDPEMATHLEISPPPTQFLLDDSGYSNPTQKNPCSVSTFDCCQGNASIYSGIEEIPFLPGSSYWSDAPSNQPSPSMLQCRSWQDFVSFPELQSRPSAFYGTTNVPTEEYSKSSSEQFISDCNTTAPAVYSFSGAFPREPERIQIDFLSNDAIGHIGKTSVYHGDQNCCNYLETNVNSFNMPGVASLVSFDQTQPYAFSPMTPQHHFAQQTYENHLAHAAHFGYSDFNVTNGDDKARFMQKNHLHCITERNSLHVAEEPEIVDSSKSCNGSFINSKTLGNSSWSVQTRREALLIDAQRRQFQQSVKRAAMNASFGRGVEEQMQLRMETGSWKPTIAQDDNFAKEASGEQKREREIERSNGIMAEMGQSSNTKHKRHSEDDQKDASPVKKSTSWISAVASGGKSEPSMLDNIPTKQNNQPATRVALNTNMKPRARQGSASDPQSIAARHRRERISERLKILQELVPNGSKVDLVTMLEKAINYVKFLQLQVKVLSSDEYWPTAQDKTPKVATRLIDEMRTAVSPNDPKKSDSGKSASGSKEKADTDLGKASSGDDGKSVSNTGPSNTGPEDS